MSTIVANVTNNSVSAGTLSLAPGASQSVKVVTADIMDLYNRGIVSLSPTPASRVLPVITDSTGGAVVSTLASIAAGTTYSQADMLAIRDAIATLASMIAISKSAQDDTADRVATVANSLEL
jgi:hypothetical protein